MRPRKISAPPPRAGFSIETSLPSIRVTALELALKHERATLLAALGLATVLSWLWIVPMARDMYGAMDGSSAWIMTDVWDATHIVLLWAMWAVMMVGMMLPSAGPMLLLYAATVRRRAGESRTTLRVYAMAAGYLLVWGLFSVIVTLLQRLLTALLILSPMMELRSPVAAGVVMLAAGIYQLTPFKGACLQSCRSPIGFFMRHWRDGNGGAFRMGVVHGLYCLGCCWALMLLLFVGGVMNLYVIAALTLFLLFEKLAPFGAQGGRLSGLLLIGLGAWVLVRGL